MNVYNATPNGSLGGIWMAGGAPVINDEGSFFVATGNGTFDAKSTAASITATAS